MISYKIYYHIILKLWSYPLIVSVDCDDKIISEVEESELEEESEMVEESKLVEESEVVEESKLVEVMDLVEL